jgi:hypothetical protein
MGIVLPTITSLSSTLSEYIWRLSKPATHPADLLINFTAKLSSPEDASMISGEFRAGIEVLCKNIL